MSHDELAVARGLRLKKLRQMIGLTSEALAKKMGVSRVTMSVWENALYDRKFPEIYAPHLIKVLKEHGVDCEESWLLHGIGAPPLMTTAWSNQLTSKLTPSTEQTSHPEIQQFLSLHSNAVVMMVRDNTMEPFYHRGDWLGGYWQSSHDYIAIGEGCIFETEQGLDVRLAWEGQQKGLFDLVLANVSPNPQKPYKLSSIPLRRLAPIIRVWRKL